MVILAGLDPDVSKSGFALIHGDTFELTTLSFFDVFKRFKQLIAEHGTESISVYIECGFLNKSNWHKKVGKSANINAKIGERTGANFETAKKLCEMCEYLGLTYYKIRPTHRKLKAKQFKLLTNIPQRTNQEMRDAFMLVFGK